MGNLRSGILNKERVEGILKKIICVLLGICIGVNVVFSCKIVQAKTEISLEKTNITMQVGSEVTLKIKGTDVEPQWSSNDEKIATVDKNGIVKAREVGTAQIKAKVEQQELTCTIKVKKKQICVLLKTTGFSGIFHQEITVSSNKDFTVTIGNTVQEYGAKKKVTISMNDEIFKTGDNLKISAKNNGKVKITSLKRSHGTPSYRGKIEVKLIDGKGLIVINKLPLEQYLYSVVNSEMSYTFSEEALKAQAVCARSFAYGHLKSEQYKEYGADLDDSSTFQVYNNAKEEDSVKKAVDDTKNIVLKDGKNIINTHYYSTSFGVSATPTEVWNATAEEANYPRIIQTIGGEKANLKSNKDFKEFIKDEELVTFDSASVWYRWNTQITKANMKKNMEEKLKIYSSDGSRVIKVLQEDGSYKGKKVSTIGSIKKITVSKREKSGMVKVVKIVGSKDTIKVYDATIIRYMFAPTKEVLNRKNGPSIENMSILPSSFFYVEKEKNVNGEIVFSFAGGGYGHGVGMSQNGANEMAKQGYDFEKILKHYFKNISVIHVVDEDLG